MTIRKTKSNGVTITTDQAEVALATDHIQIERKNGTTDQSTITISSPGEYEIAGVFVTAFDNLACFLIEAESFSIAYLSLALTDSPEAAEKLPVEITDQADILVLPDDLADLTTQFAPSLIISVDNSAKLAAKLGIEAPAPVSSLTLKKITDLPEETELIHLG